MQKNLNIHCHRFDPEDILFQHLRSIMHQFLKQFRSRAACVSFGIPAQCKWQTMLCTSIPTDHASYYSNTIIGLLPSEDTDKKTENKIIGLKQETKVFISSRHSKRQICELDWIQTQTEGGGVFESNHFPASVHSAAFESELDSNTPPPHCLNRDLQRHTDIHYGDCTKRASHWAARIPRA